MDFVLSIFENILAGYLIFVVIKFIAFRKVYRFIGDYLHFPEKDQTIFTLKYNWWNLFNPILNIPIKIKRYKKDDSQNWTGTFNSDILNPFYFKGQYIIDDPGINDEDGWHEIYLFEKKSNKLIAFNLHHLEGKTWVVDQGYYIQKIKLLS
ncbi:MAG TPA: hypothetical protein VIM16_21890 [Mucilaginibacter sp.]